MVSVRSYLSAQHVVLDLEGRTKRDLLAGAGRHLAKLLAGLDAEQITGLLAAREHVASTGVGSGIAIPHAASDALSEPCLGLYRTRRPVPFDSVDGAPVNLMVVVLTPRPSQALHLRLLASVARLVRDDNVRKRLLEVPSPEEAIRVIGEVEGSL